MKTGPFFLLFCTVLSPGLSWADTLELPPQPGRFWLRMETLPAPTTPPRVADVRVAPARFSSLAALTEHALRERPESRAAWLGIQAESARLDAVHAADWPSLTAQFGITHSRALSSSGASVPTLTRYGPSLSLSYLLLDFGARAAGIEAQRYQLIATLLNNNRVLQDIVTEVETGYAALVAADALRDAALQQEAAQRASLDAVDVRLRGGLASRADQLRARAAYAEAEVARQAAERDVAKAEAALKQAAAIPQGQDLVLDWSMQLPPPAEASMLLEDLLVEAQRQRPDLRALHATALRARAEAEQARAARWPSVALSAAAGRTFFLEDERTPSSTYSVGVNVAVPLFDGGRLAATARAAERDAERLGAEAEAAQGTVAREVADAYFDARHALAQRDGVALQLDSASESERAAAARYRAGLGSLLEWMTAQADLARARQARAQADSDWLVAFSRLNHALGRVPGPLSEGTP